MKIDVSAMLSLSDGKNISDKARNDVSNFFEIIEGKLNTEINSDDIKNDKQVDENYIDSSNEALDDKNDINDKLTEVIISLIAGENINLNLDNDLIKNKLKEILSEGNTLDGTLLKDILTNSDVNSNNKLLEDILLNSNINGEIKLIDKELEVLFKNINDNKENNVDNVDLTNVKVDFSKNELNNIKNKLNIIEDEVSELQDINVNSDNDEVKNVFKEILFDTNTLENKLLESDLTNNNINNENKLNDSINEISTTKDNKLTLEDLVNEIKLTNNNEEVTVNLLKNQINVMESEDINLNLDNTLIKDKLKEILSDTNILNDKVLESILINNNKNKLNHNFKDSSIIKENNIENVNLTKDKLVYQEFLKEKVNRDNKLTLEGLVNEIKLINSRNEKSNESLFKYEKSLINTVNTIEEEITVSLDNESNNDSFKELFNSSYLNKESYSKRVKVKESEGYDIFTEYENSTNIISNTYINKKNVELSDEELLSTGIRQEHIKEDFIKTINYIKNNDIEELNVKMNPKDLGEISIKFLKDETNEKIIITLENEEVLNLLNENIDEIQTHLYNKEIVGKSVNIEIKNDNLGYFADDLERDLSKNNNKEDKKNKKNIINNDIEDSYLEKDDNEINLLI